MLPYPSKPLSNKSLSSKAKQRRSALKMTALPLLAALPSALAQNSEKIIIHHPRAESQSDERGDYPLQMLRLALQKSGVAFSLQAADKIMPQNRAILQLAAETDIDVLWSMTSRQRERDLLPIRIPLDKGLLGWRLFLIAQQRQSKLSLVKTLQDLKKLVAVQGHDWPDTDILRANGLRVEGSPSYEFLFTMVEKGAVDYFPRSVLEIWDEAKRHRHQGLAIEQNLVLHYPTALYFFVNKRNTKLAMLLERGLQVALQDGSFDKIFTQFHGDLLRLANLPNRTRIALHNPLLPAETPLQDKRLWLTF